VHVLCWSHLRLPLLVVVVTVGFGCAGRDGQTTALRDKVTELESARSQEAEAKEMRGALKSTADAAVRRAQNEATFLRTQLNSELRCKNELEDQLRESNDKLMEESKKRRECVDACMHACLCPPIVWLCRDDHCVPVLVREVASLQQQLRELERKEAKKLAMVQQQKLALDAEVEQMRQLLKAKSDALERSKEQQSVMSAAVRQVHAGATPAVCLLTHVIAAWCAWGRHIVVPSAIEPDASLHRMTPFCNNADGVGDVRSSQQLETKANSLSRMEADLARAKKESLAAKVSAGQAASRHKSSLEAAQQAVQEISAAKDKEIAALRMELGGKLEKVRCHERTMLAPPRGCVLCCVLSVVLFCVVARCVVLSRFNPVLPSCCPAVLRSCGPAFLRSCAGERDPAVHAAATKRHGEAVCTAGTQPGRRTPVPCHDTVGRKPTACSVVALARCGCVGAARLATSEAP